MRKNYILLCSMLLLFIGALKAQTGSIAGTITDIEGSPIHAVNVSLIGTSKGSASDIDGNYLIKDVPAGDYSLSISAIGYKDQKVKVKVIAGEVTKVPRQKLENKSVKLSDVTVTTQSHKYVEEKVSKSLRQVTPIRELAQNIQVVSKELLKDQQVTSIMDGVIRNVSGVTMLEHWGHFARINMRGFRIPAFRNGFNVSDSWGPLSEDMAFTEQIEFVKGPAASMITAGEPGGIYNVVTKRATGETIREASIMGGSFQFLRASADLGGKLTSDGKLLYRFNALYQRTDTHRGNEDTDRYGMLQALTYKFTDRTSVEVSWNYQEAEQYIGAAYMFTTPDGELGSLDRDFNFVDTNFPATEISENMLYAQFNHEFSDDWSVTAQAGRLSYDQIGNSAWISWEVPQAVLEDGTAFRSTSLWDAKSKGTYLQAYANGNVTTGSVEHTILSGIDYTDKEYFADFFQTYHDTDGLFNVNNPTYGIVDYSGTFDRFLPVDERFPTPWNGIKSTAFYLQDQVGFMNNRLRVTLGGRYTSLETLGKEEKDNKFTPRIGVSFDLTDDLTVYGLFDQSFLAQTGTLVSGDALDPVTATDIEGGFKKQFFNGKVSATLGAFMITKNDLAVTDPDNAMFSIQTGEIQSRGVEFDLQGEIMPGLSAVLNYANTNVEITEDTNPLLVDTRVAGHSKHVHNLWLTYNFSQESNADGFGVSLGYQYLVNRSTWGLTADGDSELPDYFRLDGGVFWGKENLRIQLNVNNILDEYLFSGTNGFGTPYWQTEPGINGRLGVTYNFN